MVLDHVNTLSCKDILLFPDCIPYFFHLRADTDRRSFLIDPLPVKIQFLQNDDFFFIKFQIRSPSSPLMLRTVPRRLTTERKKGFLEVLSWLLGPMEDLTTLISFLEAPTATSSFPTVLEDLWMCDIR